MFDGDATVLLNNPGLVADSWLNLASAIWFFLTPQAPKPAMLHVIDRTWVPSQRELAAGIGYGFGTTINIINGGIEVRRAEQDKGQPVNRIRYWEGLAAHYGSRCWRTRRTPAGSRSLWQPQPQRRHRRALHQLGRQLEILPGQTRRLLLRV